MVITILLIVISLYGIWKDYFIKNSKKIPLWLAIVLTVLSVLMGILKYKQESDSKAELRKTTIKAHEDMISLQGEIKRLNTNLEPFMKIALQKYPTLDTGSALLKLAEDIKEIKKSIYMVNSIILTVTVTFPTIVLNPDTETMRISLGNYNIAYLKSTNKTYRINSDEMISTIAVMKDSIKYNFIYKPDITDGLLGLSIEQLNNIKVFSFNYIGELNEYKSIVNELCDVIFQISVNINNINIGKIKLFSNFHSLNSGGMYVDISPLFKDIYKNYKDHIMQEK